MLGHFCNIFCEPIHDVKKAGKHGGVPFNCSFYFLFFGGGRVVRWCWVNFQCRGVLPIWIIVGHGPIALAVGAGGGCLDIFFSSIISHFFLPLSGRRPDID